MAAPHVKNAPKGIVLIWDETNKDYVAWDGSSSINTTGLATETTLAKIPGLSIPIHDYISRAWVAGTFTETWTFKSGGSGGTTVATITIVYDDVNKSNIVTVTKV
jgi:hypothetical protein